VWEKEKESEREEEGETSIKWMSGQPIGAPSSLPVLSTQVKGEV
jgi:hypothetical protein